MQVVLALLRGCQWQVCVSAPVSRLLIPEVMSCQRIVLLRYHEETECALMSGVSAKSLIGRRDRALAEALVCMLLIPPAD